METFDKDEVLKRKILEFDDDFDHKYFRTQGIYPDIQFWCPVDGKCYAPVLYKAQPRRIRLNIKNNNCDDEAEGR